ncbi:hypothetical protein HN51_058147, partial [Arachis hypogaea]
MSRAFVRAQQRWRKEAIELCLRLMCMTLPLFSVLPIIDRLFLVVKNASVSETTLSVCVKHHSVRSANVPVPPWALPREFFNLR